MTYANQLTIARLVAVVPVMVALYVPFPGNRVVVTVVYVAALLTDYLDGILARRSKEVTAFGKLMDSIADKALTTRTMTRTWPEIWPHAGFLQGPWTSLSCIPRATATRTFSRASSGSRSAS